MTAWSPEEIAIAQENLRRRREAEYRAREAQRQKALQALRDAAPRVFPRFPAVRRAYLFGSVTDPGQIGPAPDVDVAVEGAEPGGLLRPLAGAGGRKRGDGGPGGVDRGLSLRLSGAGIRGGHL